MFRLDELSIVLTYSTVVDSIPTTQPTVVSPIAMRRSLSN